MNVTSFLAFAGLVVAILGVAIPTRLTIRARQRAETRQARDDARDDIARAVDAAVADLTRQLHEITVDRDMYQRRYYNLLEGHHGE